jgi:zinc/manganese transport system substrate-binding protein
VRIALVKVTRWLSAAAVCVITSTALPACGIGNSAHPTALAVVASTDVWGSVARAVTGGHLTVRSILTGSDVDPHSYAESPADAAAIADAPLVVYNGGGYDPWVDQVLARHPTAKAVNAYSLLGTASGANTGDPANEHVFYNLNVAKAVAATIADRLAGIDPGNATEYRANAAAFCRGADSVAIAEHAIATAYPGAGVIATEPVAYYLLAASGVVNRAPPTFTAANENETDPAPSDMAAVLDLINHRQVSALLINPQTSTPAIDGLQDAARRAGVPVTLVTEALPSGTDYLSWQRDTVDQLLAALRSSK